MDAKAEVPFEREGLVIDTFETSPQLSSEGDRNDGSTRIFLRLHRAPCTASLAASHRVPGSR